MNSEKKLINNKLIIGGLILIPLFCILIVIICRQMIIPSNQEIIDNLKDIKYYSSKVEYKFINAKSDFEEKTTQYYSSDKGMRIEFQEGLERIKVYKGEEIKVEENNDDEYTLDKNIDIIYPLAFLENIFSNPVQGEIEEIKSEWSDSEYLKVNIKYNYKNKHLDKAEFYVDKKTKMPALLKIYDNDGKERIIITYDDFKEEKQLSDELFWNRF